MYLRKNFSEFCEPYTDLACERRRADTSIAGVEYRKERASCGVWERVEIKSSEGAASIGRPIGIYDTLLLPRMDLLDNASVDEAKTELAGELIMLFERMSVIPEKILAVGLGNAALTPDSIGSEAAKRINPTAHIKAFDDCTFGALDCSEIAVIKPGVGSESGLDAIETVKGVCDRIRPDAVIAIDALAARAPERLGTTVQVASTGIMPGGGLGNPKKPLNRKTLGTPVLSIGVPTIMDAHYFLGDDINRADGRSAMFIAPKEINEIATVAAEIIAGGINRAFGIEN